MHKHRNGSVPRGPLPEDVALVRAEARYVIEVDEKGNSSVRRNVNGRLWVIAVVGPARHSKESTVFLTEGVLLEVGFGPGGTRPYHRGHKRLPSGKVKMLVRRRKAEWLNVSQKRAAYEQVTALLDDLAVEVVNGWKKKSFPVRYSTHKGGRKNYFVNTKVTEHNRGIRFSVAMTDEEFLSIIVRHEDEDQMVRKKGLSRYIARCLGYYTSKKLPTPKQLEQYARSKKGGIRRFLDRCRNNYRIPSLYLAHVALKVPNKEALLLELIKHFKIGDLLRVSFFRQLIREQQGKKWEKFALRGKLLAIPERTHRRRVSLDYVVFEFQPNMPKEIEEESPKNRVNGYEVGRNDDFDQLVPPDDIPWDVSDSTRQSAGPGAEVPF